VLWAGQCRLACFEHSHDVQLSAVRKHLSMVAGAQLTGCSDQSSPVEWQFLQCFGERTPGEEVQEGM
jgi:hypothetical protein